jgi:uncharacterized Zn finger protein (UPF0148 family)
MLAFKCPACRTTVHLPDSARGGRVVCGHCGESVYVADSNAPSASRDQATPAPTPLKPLVIEPTSYQRRRRRSSPWKVLPHFIIAGVTFFFAYKMYVATVNRRPLEQVRADNVEPRVVRPPVVKPPRTRHSTPKAEAPIVVEAPVAPNPVEPERTAAPEPELPAFVGLPASVTLPPVADDQLFIVATVSRDCSLSLASNAKGLRLEERKVLWGDQTVAGLRVDGDEVQFKWAKVVPGEAEAAVRNSLLRLKSGDESHRISMRAPVSGEPLLLDMKSPTHRIVAKCDALPPPDEIRLELSLVGQVPVKKVDGPALTALKPQDETVVSYDFTGDAATKVTVRRSGDSYAALLATQYVLPSGDIESLSIARGTRKLKELEKLQADAADAIAALPGLRNYRSELESRLRAAHSMSTGSRLQGVGYVENPVAAGQKATLIRTLQGELAATERELGRATQLAEDKPAIDLDLQAMRHVEELAKSIHEAPVPYRFYTVVDGQEIDLIRWTPSNDPLEKKPALHAFPIR